MASPSRLLRLLRDTLPLLMLMLLARRCCCADRPPPSMLPSCCMKLWRPSPSRLVRHALSPSGLVMKTL
jgi:hypothetical protein